MRGLLYLNSNHCGAHLQFSTVHSYLINTHLSTALSDFGDYDVFINHEYNEDGMLPLLNYREDGTTPYFTYFAAGLKGVKC